MVKVNQEQAKEFLETINKEDSITIFCHTDLDGFASGVLFYDFCISKGCKYIEVHPIDYGLSKILDFDLTKTNRILIADLAPAMVIEDIKKVSSSIKVFYTDHHPEEKGSNLPKNILELRTTKEGYIPSSRTVYELCGGKKWLAIAGVISDFGDEYDINKDFIESFLKESGKSLDYIKKDITYTISRAIIYFEKHTESNFFDMLKDIEYMEDVNPALNNLEKPVKEEFEKCLEDFKKNSEKMGKINFYYFKPEYNIKSFIINFISSRNKKEIYIFATPKTDVLIGLSARNQSKEYDVSKLLHGCLEGITGGSAGGHKEAAGGQIPKKELEKFKQNLRKYDIEKAKR